MTDSLWILVTAILVALVCALPGSLLMLRRQSLMGDAISHSVLPGIFLAFLFSGDRSPLFLLPGAALSGWAVAQISSWLIHKRNLSSDAALGLSFTFLFAVGVILISAFARQTDLDVDCVLFGDIVWTPLERWSPGGLDLGPLAAWTLGLGWVVLILLLILGWKGWQFTTFDAEYSAAAGFAPFVWQSVLMGMVSLASVLSFRSVGSVLVIALLSVPAATAALYVRSLKAQLIHASLWASVSAAAGWAVALPLDVSVSGAMALCSGLCFALVWVGKSLLGGRA